MVFKSYLSIYLPIQFLFEWPIYVIQPICKFLVLFSKEYEANSIFCIDNISLDLWCTVLVAES